MNAKQEAIEEINDILDSLSPVNAQQIFRKLNRTDLNILLTALKLKLKETVDGNQASA